jgi:hypothetical protein
MQCSSKLLFVTLGRGLALCLFALLTMPGHTQAAGRTTTFTTDGATAYDNWIDLTNLDDPVVGFIQLNAIGSAAQPAYELFYNVNDFNFTFGNAGQGLIPGASVKFSGGSVTSGKMVVSLNVNTCNIDPTAFTTIFGTCGIISVTWTEVPGKGSTGFTTTMHGSQDIVSGSITRHISGTIENANALAQGTLIGSALSATTFSVSVGLNRQVTVTTQSP